MAAPPDTLAKLRRQLAERFPTAPRTFGRTLSTGVAAIDDAVGGFPLAAVTEVVCAAPSCGGQLLLGQLLAVTRATRSRVALIDSTDSFDPASAPRDHLAHVLWVRCPSSIEASVKTSGTAKNSPTAQALQATDLLARDANLGVIVLDLRRAPEFDLRRIPGPQWYRLQRAVEPTDLALIVFTPRASVPSAQLRFVLNTPLTFTALETDRSDLSTHLTPVLQRQRLQIATG